MFLALQKTLIIIITAENVYFQQSGVLHCLILLSQKRVKEIAYIFNIKFSQSPTWSFILWFHCHNQVSIETRRVVQWPVLLTLDLKEFNQKS